MIPPAMRCAVLPDHRFWVCQAFATKCQVRQDQTMHHVTMAPPLKHLVPPPRSPPRLPRPREKRSISDPTPAL